MSISRAHFLSLLLGGVTVLLAACGGDDPVDPDQDDDDDGGDDVFDVALTSGLTFDPASATVAAGTTVRWTNETSLGHTVTPDGHEEWEEWVTDSQGETFQHTFETPGTYDYVCVPHAPGMAGRIVVQ